MFAVVAGTLACGPARPADKHALHDAYVRHRGAADHASASGDAVLLSREYWKESNFRDALRWAEIGVAEAVTAGDEPQRGRALNWLGNLFQIMGDTERAIEVYAEAEPYMAPTDIAEQARMKNYRAWYLDSSGRPAMAERLFEESLALARTAGDRNLIRAIASNLGDFATRRGQLAKAARYLAEARANLGGEKPRAGLLLHEARLARVQGDLPRADAILAEAATRAPPETRWQIDCERGLVAEARSDLDAAARWYADAIEIVETLRRDSAPTEVQAPFLQARWEPYQRQLALRQRRGDATGAFETIVQAQGRMFVDSLAIKMAEESNAQRDRIKGSLARIDGLNRVVPLLASSPLVGSVSAGSVLSALRASNVRHVLMYFADVQAMRLVAVVDGKARLTTVDVDLDKLTRLIDDFRADPDDHEAAAALGAAILPEGALPAERDTRIHIIPTGKLMTVGFAGIRVAGERLVDRHEIALAPSAVWLAMLSERADIDHADRIAIADSDSDLPRARLELSQVVARTGATPYMGADANSEVLFSAAGASLLHVISHSGVNRSGGYLALSSGDVGAAEILEQELDPHLVVLPTCASAATSRVEMWDSLASAFLAAGSRHVVATLSSVEDSAAAEFADLFYLHGGAEDPVGATRRAQRELSRTHSATTWSAFVVAGP